ncbi:MAG: hypothetical protein ACI80F_000135 [Natronomonas sp.]|jgi:hypothetical protein|uniref:DUF4330 family protein n=1 Tax=Natronomonas sp. TaxID=2184060 RepID=UPI003989AE5D
MEILDEKGCLFGVVNIIDAMVVLFAIAVIAAGAALVFGGDSTPDEPAELEQSQTIHVTLATSGDATTELKTGNISLGGANATVTDIHRTAGPRVYLRVALNGSQTDRGFRFNGQPVRLNDRYTVSTDTTSVNSRVIERDVSPTFEPTMTNVTLATTVREPVADAVTVGDEQTVGESTIATVTDVETSAVNETHSKLRVSVALETRTVDGTQHYGGRPVRLGRTLFLETNTYAFEADIVERNG